MSGCIHSYHIFVVHVGYGNSIVFYVAGSQWSQLWGSIKPVYWKYQKTKHHLLLTLDCLSKISTVIPMLTDPETHHLHWGLLVFRFFNSHSAQRQHHPETCQWPGQNSCLSILINRCRSLELTSSNTRQNWGVCLACSGVHREIASFWDSRTLTAWR